MALLSACGGSVESKIKEGKNPATNTYQAKPACAASSPYILMVSDSDGVNPQQLETMLCSFFSAYPKIVLALNPRAKTTVHWVFQTQPDINASAWTLDDTVYFSKPYLASHLNDTDLVVHELTHVVQWSLVGFTPRFLVDGIKDPSLKDITKLELTGAMPRWIIEATADVMRDTYGQHNKEAGWALPSAYQYGQHYLGGYEEAAAFFKWIDLHYRMNQTSISLALSNA
ncbi:MAG: DUF4157 domain-containing protein, partial [Undibacterium sp.]|nr:DUF4157 domain-containing protein [Undibacterium sp.]